MEAHECFSLPNRNHQRCRRFAVERGQESKMNNFELHVLTSHLLYFNHTRYNINYSQGFIKLVYL